MTGLRNLLDKRKTASPGKGKDVVRHSAPKTPTEAAAPKRAKTKIFVTDREPSREGLLAELLGIRERGDAGSSIKRQAVRHGEDPDAAPWWLHDPPRTNSSLGQLLPAVRRILSRTVGVRPDQTEVVAAIKRAVPEAARTVSRTTLFSPRDLRDAERELISLLTGKGPLEPLYADPWVTDIYVDKFNAIRCLRLGLALETPFAFRSPEDYEAFYTTMLQAANAAVSIAKPIVDCVLPDQWRSRVNAIHGTLREEGDVSLVIRIPRLLGASLYDLLRSQVVTASVASWLTEVVSFGDLNILIVGPGGAGKTTVLNALLSVVPGDQRVCIVEELPELHIPGGQIERIITKSPARFGPDTSVQEEILQAVLRRAAQRLVVGEIRYAEAELFVGGVEAGHRGSLATMHAHTAHDAMIRLAELLKVSELESRARVARAANLVLTMGRENGRACLMELTEVVQTPRGFELFSLVKFVGNAGKRRVWRREAMDTPVQRMLRDRGVEFLEGPTLLPAENAVEMEDTL